MGFGEKGKGGRGKVKYFPKAFETGLRSVGFDLISFFKTTQQTSLHQKSQRPDFLGFV